MATPQVVTLRDFTTSRYSQLVENIDTPLNDILARAEAAIQSRIGMSLVPTTYTETWRTSSQTLFVLRRPIVSVTSVKRRANLLFGWETLNLARTRFEPDAGYIEVLYDTVKNYEVEVVYQAGMASIPEDIREAILMQAVLFSFQDLEVYGTGDARSPGIMYMDADIDRILRPYKRTATVFH